MIANYPVVSATQYSPAVVDSLLHPQAVMIRQLLTRSGRQELKSILIDDEENILQALEAGVEILSVYHTGEKVISSRLARKLPAHVQVHEVSRRTCKKLFQNDKISRIFAIARTPVPHSIRDLLPTSRDILALEYLSISGNIGAILRTSLAFGIGAIVLLNTDPADIYDRRLIRASRGYIFSLPVVTATTDEFIEFCKRNTLPLVAMTAQAESLIHEVVPIPQRLAIVLGSEKDGCSQTLLDAATFRVRIPINPQVESLNVSAAAGIMLFNRTHFNNSGSRK